MDGSLDPAAEDRLVVVLTVSEAMIVSAALRQYEPYWSSGMSATAVCRQLATLRGHITSVIDKLRVAAAAD